MTHEQTAFSLSAIPFGFWTLLGPSLARRIAMLIVVALATAAPFLAPDDRRRAAFRVMTVWMWTSIILHSAFWFTGMWRDEAIHALRFMLPALAPLCVCACFTTQQLITRLRGTGARRRITHTAAICALAGLCLLNLRVIATDHANRGSAAPWDWADLTAACKSVPPNAVVVPERGLVHEVFYLCAEGTCVLAPWQFTLTAESPIVGYAGPRVWQRARLDRDVGR